MCMGGLTYMSRMRNKNKFAIQQPGNRQCMMDRWMNPLFFSTHNQCRTRINRLPVFPWRITLWFGQCLQEPFQCRCWRLETVHHLTLARFQWRARTHKLWYGIRVETLSTTTSVSRGMLRNDPIDLGRLTHKDEKCSEPTQGPSLQCLTIQPVYHSEVL